MSLPVLYSFRRCPYAMRARMALATSGQACRLREVVLRNKPPEMVAVSAKATVPVLVLEDNEVLEESLDIMRWALTRHDPEGWLEPERREPETVSALLAENDGSFKHHLDRYKYALRYEGADPVEHREAGSAFLTGLQDRLEGQHYLFGNSRTFADIALFPFVRQFAHTDKEWFAAQSWTDLLAWLDRCLESDLFKGVMKKYEPWQSGTEEPQFP